MSLEVRELSMAEAAGWDAFVRSSPQGSPYALSAYLSALADANAGRVSLLGVYKSGALVGGLPLLAVGAEVRPRPLLYYLTPLLEAQRGTYPSVTSAREIAVTEAIAAALDHGVVLRTMPPFMDARAFIAAGWDVRPSYSYVVPLTDLPGQWARVEQNLRRLVRRCTDSDLLEVTEDTDFDAFYDLHREALARHGEAAYLPEDRFRRWFLALHAAGVVRLFHARTPAGEPVATQLVLDGGFPATHTACVGGRSDWNQRGAQAFLRWKVFELLAASGASANDLTDAALGSVTHFKSQWGGQLVMGLTMRKPRPAPPAGIVRRLAGRFLKATSP